MKIACAFVLALVLGMGHLAQGDCPGTRAMVSTVTTWQGTVVCDNETCPQNYVKEYQYWCEGGAPNKECQNATLLWFEIRTSECNGWGSCTTTVEHIHGPGKKTVDC